MKQDDLLRLLWNLSGLLDDVHNRMELVLLCDGTPEAKARVLDEIAGSHKALGNFNESLREIERGLAASQST